MVNLSGDISTLVLKGSIKGNLGEFSLDSHMLQVIMQLDGKKNLDTVANALNIDLATMKMVITKLVELGLVEKPGPSVPGINKEFIDYMIAQLANAMGPIAEVVFEDEIQVFGGDPTKIPKNRAADLITRLAKEIPREDKRLEFQQAMVARLKTI
jgi:predicted transcriptional regulator